MHQAPRAKTAAGAWTDPRRVHSCSLAVRARHQTRPCRRATTDHHQGLYRAQEHTTCSRTDNTLSSLRFSSLSAGRGSFRRPSPHGKAEGCSWRGGGFTSTATNLSSAGGPPSGTTGSWRSWRTHRRSWDVRRPPFVAGLGWRAPVGETRLSWLMARVTHSIGGAAVPHPPTAVHLTRSNHHPRPSQREEEVYGVTASDREEGCLRRGRRTRVVAARRSPPPISPPRRMTSGTIGEW